MKTVAPAIRSTNRASKTRTQAAQVKGSAVAAKQSPLCFGKIHSNFLTCSDLKPKSICIRLAVCQCRPRFQAPPVLGKLNWQFSILFRSEGHAADSSKNKKHKQKTPHRADKQVMEPGDHAFRGGDQQFLHMQSPRGHVVQLPASRKDRLREGQTAVNLSCVYSSQAEDCPLMTIQKLLSMITVVNHY